MSREGGEFLVEMTHSPREWLRQRNLELAPNSEHTILLIEERAYHSTDEARVRRDTLRAMSGGDLLALIKQSNPNLQPIPPHGGNYGLAAGD